MTDESLESDTPNPASGRPVRAGRRALIVLAALTAVCSVALLVGMNGTEAPRKAVAQTAGSMDVTQAAAYAATSANTVQIKGYAFAPAAVTVPVGTTVTWVNEDSVPHTVTGKSGPAKFDSGQIASGGSWSGTFMTPGTYTYYCADHPQMVAQITVTGGSGGGTPPPSSTSATAPSSKPSGSPPTTTSSATHPSPPASSTATAPSSSMSKPSSSSSSAPTTPPSTSPSSSMSMPGPPTGTGGQCGVNQALTMLIQHIDSAHLGESPGQQVQDLTNLNQYVLSHTTLVANILTPLLGGATTAADSTLTQLIQHLDTAHLGESPGQQVSDLLNLDQYVLSHTTLVGNLLAPEEGLLTGSC